MTEIFAGEIVSSTLLSVCTPDSGMQMRMQVFERGGFEAGKEKEENPSVLISAINLAGILPDVPRNEKSRGGFWLPHQPQLQQRYIRFCSLSTQRYSVSLSLSSSLASGCCEVSCDSWVGGWAGARHHHGYGKKMLLKKRETASCIADDDP